MAGRRDEGLPVAIANQGGLLIAMMVLLLGLSRGGRAWIVVGQAAGGFLLGSAILKFLTAASIQGIRMKATVVPEETQDEIEETARTIAETSRPDPQPTEQVAR